MNMRTIILALFLALPMILIATNPATARQNYRSFYYQPEVRSMSLEQIKGSKENCIECHSKVTPRIVSEHKSGIHFKKGLSCETCHGTNHAGMMVVTGKKVCSKCHEHQTKEMLESKHSNSWYNSWKNARYEVLPKSMRQQGCARCHDISYGMFEVRDVRCDYCHTSHQFSADQARNPLVCNTCHMGPDHPQAEAYQASGHGGIFNQGSNNQANKGISRVTPTCVTCHQPNGTHNVSKNISIGGVSSGGVLDSWKWFMDGNGKPVMKRSVLTQDKFQKAREGSVSICSECHDSTSARQWLARADAQKMEAEKQLLTARNIIMELDQAGLLYPEPKIRPANPVEGQTLVLGGNQLYSGTSKVEAIYFKMFKFSGVGGWKSAYHQDFEGAEGINRQLLELSGELKDEAAVLKILGKAQPAAPDNNIQPALDKVDLIIPGVTGFLLGALLSVIILKLKKNKGLPFTSLFLIFIGTIIAVSIFPSGVLAWDGKEVQKCVSCHAAQYNKLKTGKHSGLQCLDCHSLGAGVAQVKKPETCGKCHSGKNGYQLETYMSSPHGINYRLAGANYWAPTCATCHMPKGDHNPLVRNPKKSLSESSMGKVCLGCHITDEIVKFSSDLEEIYRTIELLTSDLKQTGLTLIDKGLLVPDGESGNSEQLRNHWESGKWKLVKQDKLKVEEQKLVQRLINQLAGNVREGAAEASVKAKIGAAHVNPDYFHWYGNAYLNLNLSEAKGTTSELEMFATEAGFNRKQTVGWQQLLAGFCGIILGGAITMGLIRKRTK